MKKYRYGKFYPKRIIQISGVELSTKMSHEKKLSRRAIQKIFRNYKTYSILLYRQNIIQNCEIMRHILVFFMEEIQLFTAAAFPMINPVCNNHG